MLIAAGHQRKEQHRARAADRQVANLVHDQQYGMREQFQLCVETARGLRLFQRGDQVGDGAVVHAAPAFARPLSPD